MLLSIVCLIGGLVLIIAGANFLTDGASDIARRMGISDLVVGLTVVAFGTSAPELVISVISAINGSAELAVGNIVGSNIFNALAIIGITAMITPIVVSRSILTNDIPIVMLAAAVLLVMGNGPLLDGAPEASITRIDGIILLLFFVIFMRYTFAQAKATPAPQAAADPSAVKVSTIVQRKLWLSVVGVVGGLAALVFGGDIFVKGASDIAKSMGVSEAVIGLTIVAAGTSLPELAASVAAALKGHTDMAIGNVIGSNIFNIFLVLGVSATICPLPLGAITDFDLLTQFGAAVLFWLFGCFFGRRTFTRAEGALMTLLYVAYTARLVIQAV